MKLQVQATLQFNNDNEQDESLVIEDDEEN